MPSSSGKSAVAPFVWDARTALLIDGVGASLSAVFLGLVLPALQERIGMPLRFLYVLAAIAVLLAVSSLSGHRFAGRHASPWLRATILANLLYCALTGFLVVRHSGELTALGLAYFAGEIAIIAGLVWAERRALNRAARA